MAGGWSKDGAVHEQIEDSIQDELKRIQAHQRPTGESLTHCAECGDPIPEKRRELVAGVTHCVECQQALDAETAQRGWINRRGSKDSQLK